MQLSTGKYRASKLTIPNPRYMSLTGSEIAIIAESIIACLVEAPAKTEALKNREIFSQIRSHLKTKIKYFQNFYLLLLQRLPAPEQRKTPKFSTQTCSLL